MRPVFHSTPRGGPNVFHDLMEYGAVLDNGEVIIVWEVCDTVQEVADSIGSVVLGQGCVIITEEADDLLEGCVVIEDEFDGSLRTKDGEFLEFSNGLLTQVVPQDGSIVIRQEYD